MEDEVQNDMLKRVLKVIADGVDLKEIALSLAVTSPTLFLALAEKRNVEVVRVTDDDLKSARNVVSSYAREVAAIADHMRDGNWVAAIKAVRVVFGLSLKDAKDNVDAVRMIVADWPAVYEPLPLPLDDRIPFPKHDEDITGGILKYLVIRERTNG